MIKLNRGGVYTAHRVRSGTSGRGDWELIVTKAEGKGRQSLTIFPSNLPTGIREGGTFVVDDISEVEIKATKNKDGTFGKDVTNVIAVVKPCADLDGIDDLDDFSSIDAEL